MNRAQKDDLRSKKVTYKNSYAEFMGPHKVKVMMSSTFACLVEQCGDVCETKICLLLLELVHCYTGLVCSETLSS